MFSPFQSTQILKESQPLNKKYHLLARATLFNSTTEILCEVFIKLVKYCDIEKLIKNPSFQKLTQVAIQNLSAENIFKKLAIGFAQRNNVAAIKFLISECKFALTSIHDECKITLLHEACLYNSAEVVDYLLAQGADPYVEDIDGATPLQRVAEQTQGVTLIDIFKNHCLDFNRKNSRGMTVFHLAILNQNSNLITKLMQLKVNKNIKLKGMTYLQLSSAVKRGEIQVKRTPLPRINEDEEEKEINEANLFFEIINEKLNGNSLQKIKNYYLNRQLTLSSIEARHLVDVYLLANPFNLQNFKKFFNSIIAQNIVGYGEAIQLLAAVVIEFLMREMDFSTVESLCGIIETSLLDRPITKEQQAEMMNHLIVIYNKIGAFKKAEKILARSNEDFSSVDDQMRAFIYWNTGTTYRSQNDNETASLYYKKSFELVKDDIDIFRTYFLYLVHKQYYEAAAEICKLSSCGEFTVVAKKLVNCLSGKCSWQELFDSLKDNYSNQDTLIFALDIKCRCLLMSEDFEKAAVIADYIFKLQLAEMSSLKSNFAHAILKRAEVYVESDDVKGALSFYEEYQQKFPQLYAAYPPLKQFSAVIYLANGDVAMAESIIQVIPPTEEQAQQLSQLYLALALEWVSPIGEIADIEKAVHFFEMSKKLAPTNRIIRELYELVASIRDSKAISPDQLDEDLLEFDGIQIDFFKEQADNEENKEYDPKKIHHFFQQQKKQVLATLSASLTGIFAQKATWLIEGSHFQEGNEAVVSLNSQFYPNHFAMIAPGLHLDPVQAERFNQALQKGIAKRSTAQNGIKFLGGVIELKINHDLRLYTKTIYKNVDGQFLVMFDTLGNHQEIKKQLICGEPLKTVTVERAPQTKKSVNSAEALSLSVNASTTMGFLPVARTPISSSTDSTKLACSLVGSCIETVISPF